MSTTLSKPSLSPARQQLVERMQDLNFGRISDLHIVHGDPLFVDPPPRIVREVKFGGDNAPRPERERHHFLLKAQVVELFAMFDRLGTGRIDLIEVKHGIPFRMLLPETLS